MRRILVSFAILSAALGTGCKLTTSSKSPSAEEVREKNLRPDGTQAASPAEPSPTTAGAANKPRSCGTASMPGKKFVPEHSFPFDYEPFRGGCFVTFGSVKDMIDQTDVPRGSSFHIFVNDGKVYDFPDAFGGITACWVEAIAFKDLNSDGRVDVIMAGKCLGARDSYSTNAIFVNIGREFTTNDGANEKLEELRTTAEIEKYVKSHVKEFFNESRTE